ncbi:MAG: RluA family pseudouridine synthase [Bacteroidales bacterium]|nr:RluA family pseudouridine synthase [Bacteroidales bacterium]
MGDNSEFKVESLEFKEEESVLSEENTDLQSETLLYENFRYIVDKGQSPLRIDKYLMVRIENASRNKIQQAARNNCIKVNGKEVKPNYKVKPEDIIQIFLPTTPRDIEVIPQDIPLNIVYEDDDLLIVNKPSQMVVHPAYGNYSGTLVNALTYYFNPTSLQNGKVNMDAVKIKPLLVHRIDKNTTGLLVVAKTEDAQTRLAEQFYYHTIERTYTALAWGDFKEDKGTINANIARDEKDRKRMAVCSEDKGKNAVTHWEVLERFGYTTLIRCKLETGRTHQIRVHMKHIGHPLFNDETYGGDQILKGTTFSKYKQFILNCFDMLPRQALHATTLGFKHPRTKEEMFFSSELPSDMQNVIEKWQNYTNSNINADKITPNEETMTP